MRILPTILSLPCALTLVIACTQNPTLLDADSTPQSGSATGDPNSFLIVDCLLPGQLRKLGSKSTYLTARRAIRTSALDCEIRGGEYVAYDRANYTTALQVWLPLAEKGDALAQIYVGEIFEKGLGTAPDYTTAAHWYRKAADQGNPRAQISLGFLYERGLGVNRDPNAALNWYRKAAGASDVITLDASVSSPVSPALTPDQLSKIAPAVDNAPKIELIEPPVKVARNLEAVTIKTRSNMLRAIVGRVTALGGTSRLLLNRQPVAVDAQGLFRSEIQISGDKQPVEIVAVDRKGQTSALRIIFVPDSSDETTVAESAKTAASAIAAASIETIRQQVNFGNYHALIIGNNNYQHLPKLDTPINDANAIAKVLRDRYGFKDKVLIDASRYQVLSALNRLREALTEKDNLIIYYAGHGTFDRMNQRGFWLPVDAEENNTANWISTLDVTDLLNVMSAKGVLVIADSCYSGAMTLSSIPNLPASASEEKRLTLLKQISGKRSRIALTSGGLAPVLDAGSGGHSVFNGALLAFLESNHDVIQGLKLYQNVETEVSLESSKLQFKQTPQYAAIRNAGHEAGDFFLVPQ